MVALVVGQSQEGASLTYRVHIPRYFLLVIPGRGAFGCPTDIFHPRVSLFGMFGMIPMFGICEMTLACHLAAVSPFLRFPSS